MARGYVGKMGEDNVPDWVVDYILKLIDILDLEQWLIKVRIAGVIDGDASGETAACIHLEQDYFIASMDLRWDIVDSDYWRKIILHEMLHVTHSRIDAMVRGVVIDNMPDEYAKMFNTAYSQQLEPFISATENYVWRLIRSKVGVDDHGKNDK